MQMVQRPQEGWQGRAPAVLFPQLPRPPTAATVSGIVWLDTNADGIQNSSEAAYAGGATVLLLLQDGQVVANATTDAGGRYTFGDLVPGTYVVQVVPPGGYYLSPQAQGSNGTLDSDVDPTTGQSAPITLSSGQTLAGPDAGLYQSVRRGAWGWQ